MLLVDDSDHYCLYDDSEREEFLFNIFKHICLGGKLCQYEDNIDAYLDITKQIYKDLIRLVKHFFKVNSCIKYVVLHKKIYINPYHAELFGKNGLILIICKLMHIICK